MRLIIMIMACALAMVCLLVSLRGLLFEGPVVPRSPLPKQAILDMHVHVAGYGNGGSGCYISAAIRNSYKFDYYLQAFGVNKSQLEQAGDQIIVKQLSQAIRRSSRVGGAIVLALDGVVDEQGQLDLDQTEVYIPNDFVASETARYDNLYFGASINPYRMDALMQLEDISRRGAVLLKWIPSIQMIDPADERIVPFYRKLIELGLPLLTHTGQERSFTQARDELADPLKLELPLSLGVTVIAAHVATTGAIEGEDNLQRILPLFGRYPNLYADISSLTQVNKLGYLNTILQDTRVQGRLLYGSDFPLINTLLVSPFYFPLNLSLEDMWRLNRIENIWDQDVALKQALGVPANVFSRSADLLGVDLPP